MQVDFAALTDQDIIAVLQRAGVVPASGRLFLERYRVNNGRSDAMRRMSLRVWAGNKPVAHLIVGRKLSPLRRHAEQFCKHVPDIGCRPLFFVQHAGVDFFGQECRGVQNLDEAAASGRVDPAAWRLAVRQVAAALSATAKPSTATLMLQEQADFEEQVLALPGMSRLDHIFLRDTVFPLIRQGAQGQRSFQTQWTNGDFTATNIVLGDRDTPYLIDYEFASRTHFAASDWFRLLRFSRLPAGLNVEDLDPRATVPAWLEMRSWLEHMIKTVAVCTPAVAQQDLPKISERIAKLVKSATPAHPYSLFFGLREAAADNDASVPAPDADDDIVTVEWARHNTPSYSRQVPVALQPHLWQDLSVDLSGSGGRTLFIRLRLPSIPCILEIGAIEVFGADRANLLWTIEPKQLGLVLSATGNLLENRTADGLGLVQFGGESHVTLPPIRLNRNDRTAGLAVKLRFSPGLQGFTRRLRDSLDQRVLPALISDQPALPSSETEPTPAVCGQLFLPDANGNYSEQRSQRIEVSKTNTWQDAVFELPALPLGAVLRLDPTDQPGLVEITSLALEPAADDAGNPETVPAAISYLDRFECENDAVLVESPDSSATLLLVTGTDPILKLAPLGTALTGRPLRLSLRFRYSGDPATTIWAQTLKTRAIEAIRSRNDMNELQARHQRAMEQLDALRREVDAERARTREEFAAAQTALAENHEQQRARLAAELEAARAEQAKSREQEASAAARDEEMRRALDASRAQVEQHENSLQAAEARIASATADGVKYATELETLRREHARSQSHATQAAAQTSAAIADLEARVAASWSEFRNLERRHQQLTEITYAQNTHIHNLTYMAQLMSEEHDNVTRNLTLSRKRLRGLAHSVSANHHATAPADAPAEAPAAPTENAGLETSNPTSHSSPSPTQ